MAKKTPAQHFRDLFNRFMAGSTEHERKQGERAMDAWLKRHGKTRIDAPKVLTQAEADDKAAAPPPPPSDPRDAGPAQSVDSGYTVLDLIRERVELYLVFSSPHEYVAYTLWAAYTHVYEFYQHAPRLVITSPTSGCGKSRGLRVLDRLVVRPKMSDNFTTATLYDNANDRRTLLVDEADNLDFDTRGSLRAVFNSGYEKGGMFSRGVGKQKRRPKRRFVTGNTPDLDALYRHLASIWAPGVILNPDPKLPDELLRADPSVADNWRPLISVADACLPAWGTLAREAAVFFALSGRHEDPIVVLLRDIRTVFDMLSVDRITIKALVTALHEMEDGRWSEFCGVQRNRTPHKLRESELRAMLRPLGIVTRSVWPGKGKPGDHSGKGYYRSDFEAAWRAYCGDEETGKPAKVVTLKAP